LNTKIYDEVIAVANEAAFEAGREIGKKEGVLGGCLEKLLQRDDF
jgi:cysteine synthase A